MFAYINKKSYNEMKEANPRFTYNDFAREFNSKILYANQQLSEIMKQVEKYLEEKRKLFFRF